MKKNILRIVITVWIFALIMSFFSYVMAGDNVESDIVKNNFKGTIQGDAENGKKVIVRIISTSLNTVRTVGIAVAVVMLMTVACKYIMASAGDKADIKKYAFNYIIGALVLFGASGIVTIIKNVMISSE